jgi:hypothetical protein
MATLNWWAQVALKHFRAVSDLQLRSLVNMWGDYAYCAELISNYAVGFALYFCSWGFFFFVDFRPVKSPWLNCKDVF